MTKKLFLYLQADESSVIAFEGDEFHYVSNPQPCFVCKDETNWVSISFGGFICSEDCARKAWYDYEVAHHGTDLLPNTFRKQGAVKTTLENGFKYAFNILPGLGLSCLWVQGALPSVFLEFGLHSHRLSLTTYAAFRQLYALLTDRQLSEEPWSIV